MAPELRSDLSWRSLLRVVVVAAGCWLVLKLAPVLLVVVIAAMIAGALAPTVTRLERWLPRMVAIVGLFVALFGALALIGLAVAPPLARQVASLVQEAPTHQARAAEWLEAHRMGQVAAGVREIGVKADGAAGLVFHYSQGVVEVLAFGGSAVFLALYFLVDQARIRRTIYLFVPRRSHAEAGRVFEGLIPIVGGYIRGQLITSLAAGSVALVLLLVLRVDNALALALFVALTDTLPFVGAAIGIVPCVAAAAAHGTSSVVIVLVVLLVYQEIESRIIIPRVFGGSLRLPSSLVLVSILSGGVLGGIVGALLALPVAAAIVMMLRELHVEMPGEKAPSIVPEAPTVQVSLTPAAASALREARP